MARTLPAFFGMHTYEEPHEGIQRVPGMTLQDDHYSVDLRSKRKKDDTTPAHLSSLTFSMVSDILPTSHRVARIYEKTLALVLVAGFAVSPFGWVFAEEEPAPETPPPTVEEPAPTPEAADTNIEPPPAPVIDPGPVEEPEEASGVEQGTPEETAPPEESQEEEVVEEVATQEEDDNVSDPTDTEDTEEIAGETEEVDDESVNETEGIQETETQEEEQQPEERSQAVSGDGGSTDIASSTQETDDATAAESEDGEVTEEENVEESTTASSTVEVVSEESSTTEEGYTQPEEVPEEVEVSTATPYTNNDSRRVFSADDCVMVREGEFYCIRGDATVSQEPATTVSAADTNALVAARKDAGGDKEIFFNQGGTVRQITNNSIDDDAPVYDAASKTIVWHALVNDRYQIMRYNITTGVTEQLTNTTYNNTNPYVQGDLVVWQGWIGSGWEIFMTRGSEAPVQITHNDYPDMFPRVYQQFITWQAREGSVWQSYLYDTTTGLTSKIGDGEAGFESPRFVLMVERRNENGDIERVGYDINTGESIALGTTPKSEPEEPSVPEDPLKDQKSVMPPNQATTTLKTSPEDDEADADD